MTHTPIPWRLIKADPVKGRHTVQVRAKDGQEPTPLIADCHLLANAEFIVRAVNSHDELLRRLHRMTEYMDDSKPHYFPLPEVLRDMISAAIKAASSPEGLKMNDPAEADWPASGPDVSISSEPSSSAKEPETPHLETDSSQTPR